MLYKNEVVKIMTDTINDMNRQMGQMYNVPSAQIEEMIEKSTDELNRVNGLLYDKLKEVGIIQ